MSPLERAHFSESDSCLYELLRRPNDHQNVKFVCPENAQKLISEMTWTGFKSLPHVHFYFRDRQTRRTGHWNAQDTYVQRGQITTSEQRRNQTAPPVPRLGAVTFCHARTCVAAGEADLPSAPADLIKLLQQRGHVDVDEFDLVGS